MTAIEKGEVQTIRSMIVDSNIDVNAGIFIVSIVMLSSYILNVTMLTTTTCVQYITISCDHHNCW